MKMDRPEYQEIVLQHIRRTNKFEGCTARLPIKLCVNTVKNYRKHNAKFDQAVNKAFEIYKALHPDENQELILETDKRLLHMAKNGWVRYIEDKDPKTGETLKLRIIRSPDCQKWVYDRAHPDRSATEEGLVSVTGNMYKDLVQDETIEEELRNEMLKWLANWKRINLEELQMRGLVKHKELLE